MSSPRIKHIAVNPRAPSPTREQLAVLGVIAKQPKGVHITTKLIAHELGIPEQTARNRVSRMKRDGLIRKGGGWEVCL